MFLPTIDSVWDLRITRAKFGLGAINEIGYDLARMGVKKALIVTDEGLMKTGWPEEVKSIIEEVGIKAEIWAGVEPEPSIESIKNGIDFAKNRDIDGFVGLGGGSSIDTMKVINLITTYGGDIIDYVSPPTGKGKKVPGRLRPMIAVPTTAGTGSETSPVAVIGLPQGIKVGISDDECRPHLAILDPQLTITLPPKLTASTGIDALSHAIEAYVTRRFDWKERPKTPMERPPYGGKTPITDMFAEKAIELIARYLRRAVYNGRDLEARSNMLLASFLAGVAFTNAGLGADHALAMALGGRYHVPHGIACGLFLPEVMRFNTPAAPERLATIAYFFGENIEGLSFLEAAELAVEAVISLERDIGLPNGLAAIGVKEEDIPEIAADAFKLNRLLVGNPRPVTLEDLENIIRASMHLW
ncbi:MAG: hydroxyacid-oxoacid transhydrogenase [Candidatus Njordarchaeales archaeon]